MNLVDTIGCTALIITLTYTCLGLPAQIRKNYVNKSTAGLSLFMTIMLLLTFSSWVTYALVKSPQDWYIAGSNFPGAICVVIVLCQFRLYRAHS